MNGIVLDLPVPPSVNARARRKRAWYQAAHVAIARQARPEKLKGRLAVAVRLPRLSVGVDLDNRIKPLIDVLWRAGVIGDDSQIDWLLIQWGDACEARVIVSGIYGGSVAAVESVFQD